MSKLKELERRLRDEPDNLGLRVVLAGALHDAGRRDDAIELYRSVAIAYREQGRAQQAITVCRSILELAPDDAPCQALLATLLASQPPEPASPPPSPPRPSPTPSVLRPSPPPLRPPSPAPRDSEPRRRSSGEVTPLPTPLPYHVAEPTSSSQQKLARIDLPPSLQDELASYPEIAGIANAARQISASLIAASQQEDEDVALALDTSRFQRASADDVERLSGPPSGPVERVQHEPGDGDDDPTLPPRAVPRTRAVDDETTEPRERPAQLRPPSIAPPTVATGPLASAFFAPVPPHNRPAVLQRFRRRMAASGMTVIRRGEVGHGLVLVVRGRLELTAERADGSSVVLEAVSPGEYVGEVSLLARAPAAAHVVAAMQSELLVLPADDFYEVASAFPALWSELELAARRRARDHAQRLA